MYVFLNVPVCVKWSAAACAVSVLQLGWPSDSSQAQPIISTFRPESSTRIHAPKICSTYRNRAPKQKAGQQCG